MKALQSQKILALFLGIFFSTAFALKHPDLVTAAERSPLADGGAGTARPIAASPTAAKPVGLDAVQLGRSLDRGDVAGGIQQIELGWKRQFENYYQGKLTSRLLNVEQIVRVLEKNHRESGQKAALIYAVPATNHLELILVAPGGPPVHRRVTAANRDALAAMTKAFRNEVANPSNFNGAYLPSARALYQWTIAPLEPDLKARGINSLIFCLGKGLRGLPLAALHDGQQFLVEKYSLSIIPAFNLLDNRVSKLQNVYVLAMGASEFKDKSALPGVPLELSTIVNRLGRGERWLNQDFTLANLKARRDIYPFEIVHFATHAKFLPGDVTQSYIQFWDDQLRQDRFKSLGLRSPAVQLLVLSACQTALGDAQAELGFAGLAVQSGSKAALASLWAVSDTGTLALMSEFYRQIPSASIKADALRKTQIAMLKGRLNLRGAAQPSPSRTGQAPTSANAAPEVVDYTHPYYWSAFTLVGNPW
ncbi:CHAT domain-containing protein [Altericista sp. CCNU0014]|uniref:CHAT domain-containing protein n=1 Tax=Altericista sp. CCNU0014 TaxID=3082949 RepID=UPI00384D3DD8